MNTTKTRDGDPTSRASRHCISSEKLLQGGKQLDIEHNGEFYTLRVTAKDKLILTK